MTRRSWLVCALLAALGCEATKQRPAPEPEAALKVYTDMALLRRFVDLPESVRGGRFIDRKIGLPDSRLAPGPNDYELEAFVEMSEESWNEMLGFRPDDEHSILHGFDEAVARALFPSALPPAAVDGKTISIPVVAIKSTRMLDRGRGRHMTRAYRVGNGLYFVLATM